MESLAQTEALILELETRLLRPELRRQPDQVAAILDDGFREFGASGRIWDKPSVIAALQEDASFECEVSDFELRPLADDVVLATYRIRSIGTPNRPAANSLRSSLWRRTAGTWRLVFHQGTPA